MDVFHWSKSHRARCVSFMFVSVGVVSCSRKRLMPYISVVFCIIKTIHSSFSKWQRTRSAHANHPVVASWQPIALVVSSPSCPLEHSHGSAAGARQPRSIDVSRSTTFRPSIECPSIHFRHCSARRPRQPDHSGASRTSPRSPLASGCDGRSGSGRDTSIAWTGRW